MIWDHSRCVLFTTLAKHFFVGKPCTPYIFPILKILWIWLQLCHRNKSSTSIFQCTDLLSLLQYNTEECRARLSMCSMMKQRMTLCCVTNEYAERPALEPWVSLWLRPRLQSSLPLPGFQISFLTRKLNHSKALLFERCPMMGTDIPRRKSNLYNNKKNTCYTPLKTQLSQFFRLWGRLLCLWHNPVFEKPSHCTLLSLCARCVFMQACTLTSPCTVLLSSSFDKLTCKGGLFTRLRVGHLPPPGMQAWASLCVCQIDSF